MEKGDGRKEMRGLPLPTDPESPFHPCLLPGHGLFSMCLLTVEELGPHMSGVLSLPVLACAAPLPVSSELSPLVPCPQPCPLPSCPARRLPTGEKA